MQLHTLRIENVGGFQTTRIDLSSSRILIGENNSGKTGLLRILDWVFNTADRRLLDGSRQLTSDEEHLLVPARPTRNKARRLVLQIHVPDGRTARRYNATNHIAELRIQFRQDGTYGKVAPPSRGENPSSDRRAIELLELLQRSYCTLYIAAARDSRSAVFSEALGNALHKTFSRSFIHQGPGRNTKAERVKELSNDLKKIGEQQATELWSQANKHLNGIFAPDAHFEVDITPQHVLDALIQQTTPKFSLGDHDESRVPVEQLGAGLQSMLAMALNQLAMSDREHRLLLLEEPEAFLHPTAQRTLGWHILKPNTGAQLLVTTHSPLVLGEAQPSEVVVLRGHRIFSSQPSSDLEDRKDRYLLSTAGAGTMFDRSVLLVEGPGDQALFERLRRRLQPVIPPTALNRIRVQAVGSKTSFAPWLRLLRRYRDSHASQSLAFNVLVCADSVDAGSDVLQALKHASIKASSDFHPQVRALRNGLPKDITPDDAVTLAQRTLEVNREAASHDIPVHFMPVDLEYGFTQGLSNDRASQLATSLGIEGPHTPSSLASCLGSKGGASGVGEHAIGKAPYARAELADFLHWDELSTDLKDLLWRWVRPAYDEPDPKRPTALR